MFDCIRVLIIEKSCWPGDPHQLAAAEDVDAITHATAVVSAALLQLNGVAGLPGQVVAAGAISPLSLLIAWYVWVAQHAMTCRCAYMAPSGDQLLLPIADGVK